MASKSDIQLAHLAGEIQAAQLVLVAYLAGIAEASPGGHRHIEAVFRLAGKLAEAAGELTGGELAGGELAGGERQADHARRVQKAIEDLKALIL